VPAWSDGAIAVLLDEINPTTPHMLELRHLGGPWPNRPPSRTPSATATPATRCSPRPTRGLPSRPRPSGRRSCTAGCSRGAAGGLCTTSPPARTTHPSTPAAPSTHGPWTGCAR
jgi:hypothetical protein